MYIILYVNQLCDKRLKLMMGGEVIFKLFQ